MSFIKNLNWRYATKKFDGRKLPADVVEKILTSIHMAPSAFGIQPYHVTVVENNKLKEILQPHAGDQEQITTCSHLLVFNADLNVDRRVDDFMELAAEARRNDVTDDPEFDYRAEGKKFAKQMGAEWTAKQAYIALGFAIAACAELKVDACPMEAFDPIAFKKALNLPSNLEPKVLLAVGYRSREDDHAQARKIRFAEKDLFDFK
ncbi:MAG: NAD(P)H-dependent oxidoreductase [Candidatus Jorgensenbacteria bacterium]